MHALWTNTHLSWTMGHPLTAETAGGSTSIWIQLAIAAIGAGGIGGFLLSLIKYKPEAASAAIVQAQGANEVMAETIKMLQERLEEEQKQHALTRRRLYEERERSQHLQQMLLGHQIFDDDTNFPPKG